MTMKFARGKAVAALACAAALALGACSGPTGGGGQATESPGSGAAGEVTFAYLGDAANLDVWESLFAEFNKVHPEIDVYSQFAQGKLAMVTGGRWPTINIRDIDMVDKTVIVNWPTKVANGTPVGWDAWNITKVSPNKDAAWTLIKFLMSKEAGAYFASIGGTIVPARESVANYSAFTDNAPKGAERLSQAMSFATPIPSPDKGAEVQQAIEDAWLTILTGNGEIADVLASTQQELQDLVRD